MKPQALEDRMRALEVFHGLRVLPEAWFVLRLDGRSFSRFTEKHFQKPFDQRFHELMLTAGRALMTELKALYLYTESDEISLLFGPAYASFDREVEKLVSISASVASASFSLAAGVPVQFDSRVWVGPRPEQVVDYFRWRATDAARCALNGWCYWTLRHSGLSMRAATAALVGKSVAEKHEQLFQAGINFNDLPAWQRRGTGLYFEDYEKAGFDPVRQVEVKAWRRRLTLDEELPLGEDYAQWLRERFLGSKV